MQTLHARNPAAAAAGRAVLLLAGWILPQVILFGPSLAGTKVLLPLDILTRPGTYMPLGPTSKSATLSDSSLLDEVFAFEYWRRFSAGELRAGRLPLWDPHIFAGAPFAVFPTCSPFHLLYCLNPSPFMLPWVQLAKALVAGMGAYLFFRRVLGVSFWPAAFGAWCWPLVAFHILWQGFYATCVTPWLAWVLLATHQSVRRPGGAGPLALACLTGVTIVSGQIDIALQVLLVSGLYAVWCLFDEYRKGVLTRRGLAAAGATAVAWALGVVLAAIYLLPMREYLPTGARMILRSQGQEERPPIGLAALLPTVLPEVNGLFRPASDYFGPLNLIEGPSAAYSGLLALLLLAPLGWCCRRSRSINGFWVALVVLFFGWDLNLPGVVQLLRLPGLNMLSHNRSVFVTAFAVLALAVSGLEVIWQGLSARRWWFAVPVALLVALASLCVFRLVLPQAMPTPGDPRQLSDQELALWVRTHAGLADCHLKGLLFSLLALAGWYAVWRPRPGLGPGLAATAGLLLMGELLVFGHGLNPQCDPSLYYPPLPILEGLKRAPPGRVLGVGCLPPNLLPMKGLRDIRGYDAVDPLQLLQVLDLAQVPNSKSLSPSYAQTQFYRPHASDGPEGELRLPPVLSMLNVRYLIYMGECPNSALAFLETDGYWAAENKLCLPRAFVPQRVVPCPGQQAALGRIAEADFDPALVAYVDAEGPALVDCRGTAEVVEEEPCRVTVAVDMQTPGLLVLADLWYPGWAARLNGEPVSVLRTNHALRGVEVPAGKSTLEFRYEPASFRRGVWLTAAATVVVLIWGALLWRRRRLEKRVHKAAPMSA